MPATKRGVPQPSLTPQGKRPRSLARHEQPEATDEDVERRLRKKANGVLHVKSTPDYLAFSAARVQGYAVGDDLPCTPDQYDLTISKRDWEASMQKWRKILRNWILRFQALTSPGRILSRQLSMERPM